ncbi:hypothetical protein ABEF89_01960 [Acinetobacter thermotolerans]
MKKYTQLSQDERYEIYATLKSKSSIANLALNRTGFVGESIF